MIISDQKKGQRRWYRAANLLKTLPASAISTDPSSVNHPIRWVIARNPTLQSLFLSIKEKETKNQPLVVALSRWIGLPYEDIYSIFISRRPFEVEKLPYDGPSIAVTMERYLKEGRFWESCF